MAATTTVATNHVPNADLISLVASIAKMSIADTQTFIHALPEAIVQLLAKKGLQSIELPRLGTIEEHRKAGTTPPALGSIKYDTANITFRSSQYIKDGLAAKSNALLPDGTTRQLTYQEYESTLE